ncbi:MAG: EAL domain-containing protein [Pseudomonadota bacterium]
MDGMVARMVEASPFGWLVGGTLLMLLLLLALLLVLVLRHRRMRDDMRIVEEPGEGGEPGPGFYGDDADAEALPMFSPRQQQLWEALSTALASDEPFFDLYAQPIFRLADGRLLGGEVLIRWHHDELGQISPGEFIPVAELTGQILQLDRRVLASVIERLGEEPRALLQAMCMDINVSIQHFRDVSLVHHIQSLCDAHEVPITCLELEVTEHAYSDDLERVGRCMGLVRSHGMGLALDDFGTGYTSLRFLQSLPFSRVKLDRSYVSRIDHDQQSRRLVACLVEMAHTLGMRCIAEGIEQHGEMEQLQRMGCEAGQGFLLERPMPLEEFLALARGSLLFKGRPLRDSVETITGGATAPGEAPK